eukprot:51458-Chlamydomonas_euryale.AAC.2
MTFQGGTAGLHKAFGASKSTCRHANTGPCQLSSVVATPPYLVHRPALALPPHHHTTPSHTFCRLLRRLKALPPASSRPPRPHAPALSHVTFLPPSAPQPHSTPSCFALTALIAPTTDGCSAAGAAMMPSFIESR